MDIEYIIMCLSVIVQAFIGYETGNLVSDALTYSSSRGRALGEAFVVLILVVVRFLLDRWLILGRKKKNGAFSPIILDIAAFVLGTFTSLITLEMYATKTVSVTFAVMMLVVFLSVLYEKDIYMQPGEASAEEDPYLLDDLEEDDDKISEEKDDDIILEEVVKTEENEAEEESEEDDLVIVNWTEESSNDSSDKAQVVSKETGSEASKEDDEEDDEEAEAVIQDSGIRIVVAEAVRLLANVSSVAVGSLILADIVAEKFSPLYYMMIGLVAVLAVILRAVTRGLDTLIKSPSKKAHFIGYSVTVLMFTILLCTRSILVGLVYLLGSYLVKLIIPMAMNYWGTGGQEAVKQKIDILSRLVTRVFAIILLMLGVWLLSYGAIWEIDFMIIISVAIGTGELLMRQNKV